eukprot:g1194.t1
MDKLARLIMLMMAALGTLMVVTMPWHSASAMAEGAGDNGADDDDGDDVDELIFETPVHIDESWKQAVHEYRDFIRESEGGLGTVCSKDEHCEEGKICDRNGRCKPNATDIDDACRYGLHTCMHKENSVMRKLAEQETKNRLGRVGSEETNTEKLLATALLPAPAQPMMQLPAPASMAEEGSEEHKAGAMLLSNAGSKGEGAGGGSNAVALTSSMAAYIKSVDLVENVAGGALTASGALPHDTHKWLKLAQDGRERVTRRPFYNYWDKEDRAWRVATGKAEANARKNAKNDTLKKKAMEFPNKNDIELREWFEKGGGKLNFIEPHGRESIKDSKARHLRAAEDISENDVVLEVPLKLTLNQLTVRNIPTQSGRYLGEYIGGCFGKDQDWGLAALLLYELHKGNTSKWWPFIRTLDMHVLSRGVLNEMRGTYAAELQRNWETEAESMLKYLDKHIGQKDHMGNVKKWSTRKELRWALWAVRRHAVSLTKVTTGKRIRALVPFANYLTHSHGAGGSVTVGLDNKVRIALSAHDEGQELRYEREPYGDGEELLRFHTIDDSRPNPNNRIKIALPGARTRDAGDVFWEWHTSKMWRRFMKYPPSQSDLWRIANKLHLYGEEWDEDEQKAISNSNRILSGLPMPTDMVSAEEQLMLLGHASTPEEAQLIVYGGPKKEVRPENVQLYTAPDPED